jgi:hypothetical protein
LEHYCTKLWMYKEKLIKSISMKASEYFIL